MNVAIKSVTLNNFKCYTQQTIDFVGADTIISGRNGIGKSTIIDAIVWCFTGKLPNAKAEGASIRPVGEPVEVEPEVEVTATIDGAETVFYRRLEPTYSGRGADKVYKGDATVCNIDGVPKSVTDFSAYVAQIFPINATVWLDLLSFADDTKFSADERRKVLVDAFGKITDDEVKNLMADEGINELFAAKGKLSVEDYKIAMKEQEKSCNAELGRGKTQGTLQARIDEAMKSIIHPELSIAAQEVYIADLEAQIKDASSGNDLTAKLREAQKALMDAESEAERNLAERKKAVFADVDNKLVALMSKRTELSVANRENAEKLETLRREVANRNLLLDNERNKITTIELEEAKYDTVCPTCGQPIPQERIDEIIGNFNENKAVRIEECEKHIADLMAENGKAALAEDALEKAGTKLGKDYNAVLAKIEKLNGERKDLEAKPITLTAAETKKIKALNSDVEEIKAAMAMQDTSARVAELTAQLKAEQSKLAEAQANDRQRSRIIELKNRQKEVAEMLSNAQRMISLCDDFITERAKFIENSIAAHFEGVSFKLFDVFKNGEIKNACVPMVDGKPFSLLSFSQKTVASVAILNGLSDHYGFTAPCLIDNASEMDSVTTAKLTTKGQKIIVKVSDGDFGITAI